MLFVVVVLVKLFGKYFLSLKIKFTIFLPVRNGGEHFRQCVASILAQTYQEFSLVVLDNASEDQNIEWLRNIGDPKVEIIESSKPLSIEDNWARILTVPKHEFMTIIGHDDLLDPGYLEIMSNLIDKYPDAGLYQAHFRLIDGDGKFIRLCRKMPLKEREEEFLESRLLSKRDSFGTGFLFASASYEKLGGIPLFEKLLYADDALWLKLMHGSWKATSEKVCFSYRLHTQSTSYSPNWNALFNALDCYLDTLEEMSRENDRIAEVVQKYLATYVISFYRWFYFSARYQHKEVSVLRERIILSSHKVNDLLNELNMSVSNIFIKKMEKQIFSGLIYYLWWAKRLLAGLIKKMHTLSGPRENSCCESVK